jgi:hypothetical protein
MEEREKGGERRGGEEEEEEKEEEPVPLGGAGSRNVCIYGGNEVQDVIILSCVGPGFLRDWGRAWDAFLRAPVQLAPSLIVVNQSITQQPAPAKPQQDPAP